MLKKRLLFPLLSCFGLMLAWAPSWALGFRDASPAAALGRPLDFVVTLRVAPGESVDPDCVRAEVTIGDMLVPSEGVGAQLETSPNGPPRIRVRTYRRVDEPVVSVQVSAGCGSQVSRKYVVFADPPLMTAPPVLAEAMPPAPAPARVEQPTRVAATAMESAAELARPTIERADLTPPAPRPVRRVRRAAAPERNAAAAPPASAQRQVAAKAATAPAAAPVVAAADTPAPTSRLTLDARPGIATVSSITASEQAMAAVEEANNAVLAAIAAASAAQARMVALEASVERLQKEAAAQAALTVELRLRAEAGERRTFWFLPLLAGLLALVGLAMWLWLRVRDLEQRRQQAWRRAAARQEPVAAGAAAPTSKVPVLDERSIRSAGGVAARGGLAPPAVPNADELFDDPPEPQRTSVSPPVSAAPAPPAQHKGVSAEELIDLEQQAEFFVVLGQDESAIDLLVDHLRQTGGTSPLPYLKLLEIYRRRGDRSAYERTRDRFNHRFNAHAPDWDAPAAQGHSLQDYPAVLHWIERVWPTPIDAMAELEVLLFRRDGGELFDLPAYRELLFLYSLARDLIGHESQDANALPVDVLLPLHDQADASVPVEPIAQALESTRQPPAELATAPVDLDLSEPSDSSFRITR